MPALRETFAYRLRSAKKVISTSIRQNFRDTGISRDTFIVLRTIYENPGLTQREIGESCGKDANVIVKLIDRLEDMGFVRRVRGERDRRTFTIFATDTGARAAEDFWSHYVEQVEKILNVLSEREKEELSRMLDKILNYYESAV